MRALWFDPSPKLPAKKGREPEIPGKLGRPVRHPRPSGASTMNLWTKHLNKSRDSEGEKWVDPSPRPDPLETDKAPSGVPRRRSVPRRSLPGTASLPARHLGIAFPHFGFQ